MGIKLTANSVDAENYLLNLGDKKAPHGFAYYHGFGEKNDQDSKTPWGLKLFSKIEKTFFKSPLPEAEKEIINYVNKSAEFLNNFFSKSEPDYISNMTITMNVNSSFNQFAKKSIEAVSGFYPSYLSELKKHVDSEETSMEAWSKKMIIGSSSFMDEFSEEYPFASFLIETMGKEKAVAFVVFHEASHAFQFTNIEKYNPIWEDGISDILLYSSELFSPSPTKPNKQLIDVFNDEIKNKRDENFSFIDPVFAEEIFIAQGEIYADVSAILLARNADIEKGKYSLKNISKLIDFVIEARHKEFGFSTSEIPSKYSRNVVSYFNHFTVPGLEYLKETLNSIPEKVLSQKEIFEYATSASHRGLARILLSSAYAHPENMEQLNMIFNLDDLQGSIALPEKIDKQNTFDGLNLLKNLAGEAWVDKFNKNLELLQNCNVTDKTRAIWNAGTNQKLFEQNLALDLDKSSNNNFTKDKDDIFNAVNDIRNKIFSNFNSFKNKI